jgi:hypothetical protein
MPITIGHPDESDIPIIENYKGVVLLNGFVNPQQRPPAGQ